MFSSKVIGPALVAAAIIILGLCLKAGIDNFSNRDRVVTVRGLCEKEVTANLVTWPIVTKEMGNDLTAIYDKIQQTNATITQFLTSNGISSEEILINPPAVEDRQANMYSNTDVLKWRYTVTNVIVVTSSKVQQVNDLMRKQPELMRKGIAVVAGDYEYRTSYDYTDLNSIKPQMIAEATRNAREAADKFAADSGSDLGKIKTASQGQFSITDRDKYTPYVKNVRVVTSITYYLKN